MGTDPILNLAQAAQAHPEAVMHELTEKTPAERAAMLEAAMQNYAHQAFRVYDPSVDHAVRQLMANEFVAGPKERKWDTFFQEKNHPNTFAQTYLSLWKAAESDKSAFFSQPEMLTYVLQTVAQPKSDGVVEEGAAALITAQGVIGPRLSGTLDVSGHPIKLYSCGYFDITSAGIETLRQGVEWLLDLGYALPVAIDTRDQPGGYHYYDGRMCEPIVKKGFLEKGNAVKIGLIPKRAPCTARHELSHVIYAQLDKATHSQVKALYKQAMAADYGLIFNDEYYMHQYLHAGHPMLNDSEFFAGAMHAYTHHREELLANINAETTPKAVKAYALATVKLMDRVLVERRLTP